MSLYTRGRLGANPFGSASEGFRPAPGPNPSAVAEQRAVASSVQAGYDPNVIYGPNKGNNTLLYAFLGGIVVLAVWKAST